jgi:hypothetical protein
MNPLVEKMVRPGVDEMQSVGTPEGYTSDMQDRVRRALEQIKERFVAERVHGFNNPETGEKYEPVPEQEALARWATIEARFLRSLQTDDEGMKHNLGINHDVPGGTHGGPSGRETPGGSTEAPIEDYDYHTPLTVQRRVPNYDEYRKREPEPRGFGAGGPV